MQNRKTRALMALLLAWHHNPPMRTIDIHAHWYPREWLDLLGRDGAKEGARLERTPQGGYKIQAKHIVNAFDERFVGLDGRLEAMDKARVDVHALSLTTPMV